MRMPALMVLIVASSLAGCFGTDDGPATSPPPPSTSAEPANVGSGTVSFFLKDAPADVFDEIHINVTRVEAHLASEGNGTAEACTGWREIANGTVDIDLLAASGDLAAFIGEAALPACKVTQIRVHISEAWGLNGTRTAIHVANPTLRIVRAFDVPLAGHVRIIADLDLERSLRQNAQGWHLTPIIGRLQLDETEGPEGLRPGQITQVPP